MLATVSSVAQLAWCAASSRGHQRSSVALSGRKGSSGLISAARLVCCFLSVLSQPRLPICLLLRCNLVASSVHLLMTALPTGFVIVRRLPLQRPFRRTQMQTSHTQVAIRSQSAVISVPHLRSRQAPLTHRQLVGRLLRQLALESCFPRRRKRRGGGVRLLERLVQQALLWGGERPSALVISGHQWSSVVISGHQRRPSPVLAAVPQRGQSFCGTPRHSQSVPPSPGTACPSQSLPRPPGTARPSQSLPPLPPSPTPAAPDEGGN